VLMPQYSGTHTLTSDFVSSILLICCGRPSARTCPYGMTVRAGPAKPACRLHANPYKRTAQQNFPPRLKETLKSYLQAYTQEKPPTRSSAYLPRSKGVGRVCSTRTTTTSFVRHRAL
jgi:hypothetical protein